jgi:hypothetical protein
LRYTNSPPSLVWTPRCCTSEFTFLVWQSLIVTSRLITAPASGSFKTDNIILPSPFTASQQQITTATIIRARQDASSTSETVAILSDGPQATTKLIIKLVSPTDALSPWFEATVASVRVIDLQAWASCVAHELDWE